MLFSKANLAVVEVASSEAHQEELNAVHFEKSGVSVASNGRVLVAVGPAKTEEQVGFPSYASNPKELDEYGVLLSKDVVSRVYKSLPKDEKGAGTRHMQLSNVQDKHRVGLTTVSLTGDPNTLACVPKRRRFPNWKRLLRAFKRGQDVHRVCINRRDLVEALKTLEAVAPDKGGINPLFIEVGENSGMLLRCASFETGQHALGYVNSVDTKGEWLKLHRWEKECFVRETPK
jgi:hypothetical protein